MKLVFNVQLLFDTQERSIEVPGFITRRILSKEDIKRITDLALVEIYGTPKELITLKDQLIVNRDQPLKNDQSVSHPYTRIVERAAIKRKFKTHKTLKDITLGKRSTGEKIRAHYAARTKKGLCLRCDRKHLKNKRLCTTHNKLARESMLRARKKR